MKNLLFIGDSIYRSGYRRYATKYLSGKVNVLDKNLKLAENCRSSRELLQKVQDWYGSFLPKANFIHFNCGAHDVMFFHWGNIIEATPLLIGIEEYRLNINKIVKILFKYKAKLIIAGTTPVDEERHLRKKQKNKLWDSIPGRNVMRYNKDIRKYNEILKEVAVSVDAVYNDLYQVVVNNGINKCVGPDGIHLKHPEGGQILGKAVANKIIELLKQ